MMDGKEILDLLEKIDNMVSENDPRYYRRQMCDERKKHLHHKSGENFMLAFGDQKISKL